MKILEQQRLLLVGISRGFVADLGLVGWCALSPGTTDAEKERQ
jgi:hypothetical protein